MGKVIAEKTLKYSFGEPYTDINVKIDINERMPGWANQSRISKKMEWGVLKVKLPKHLTEWDSDMTAEEVAIIVAERIKIISSAKEKYKKKYTGKCTIEF